MSTDTSTPSHLLSLRELSGLGYGSYSTLRKYISDGRLSAVRVGGRIKVRREDLQHLVSPAGPRNHAVLAPHEAITESPVAVLEVGEDIPKPETSRDPLDAIQRLVDAAPPLTNEQRERLAVILGGAS